MKFSANLGFLFPEIPSVLDKYRAAKEAGFKGVECGDVYQHSIDELVSAKNENQLEQVLLNTCTFVQKSKGYAAVPGQEEQFRKSLEISIKYCKALGCPRLHVLAGQVPNMRENLCFDTFVSNLAYASQKVSNQGITLLIEPISAIKDYFLTNTSQAVKIIEQVDSPVVKLQLDLYHQQMTQGRIVGTLADHCSLIEHIQIAQVPGRHEPDSPGEINFKFVFDEIARIGYKGWVGCEYVPSQDNFDWMLAVL